MLKEYKFSKLEAMRHIEAANGKKLLSFGTGTAYYNGEPRVYWQLEGEKDEWDNPNPRLGGRAIDALFFPKGGVVSRKVDVYSETFEFIVREGEHGEKEG